MSKSIDIFCIVLWGVSIVIGILAACGLVTISPLSYICACLIGVLHHAERLASY